MSIITTGNTLLNSFLEKLFSALIHVYSIIIQRALVSIFIHEESWLLSPRKTGIRKLAQNWLFLLQCLLLWYWGFVPSQQKVARLLCNSECPAMPLMTNWASWVDLKSTMYWILIFLWFSKGALSLEIQCILLKGSVWWTFRKMHCVFLVYF